MIQKKPQQRKGVNGYQRKKEREIVQEWDILKNDIEELDIDPRAKYAFINLLQRSFGGRKIYVRANDAIKERRREAILSLLNQNVAPIDAGIYIAARFKISRHYARTLVTRALRGDL